MPLLSSGCCHEMGSSAIASLVSLLPDPLSEIVGDGKRIAIVVDPEPTTIKGDRNKVIGFSHLIVQSLCRPRSTAVVS